MSQLTNQEKSNQLLDLLVRYSSDEIGVRVNDFHDSFSAHMSAKCWIWIDEDADVIAITRKGIAEGIEPSKVTGTYQIVFIGSDDELPYNTGVTDYSEVTYDHVLDAFAIAQEEGRLISVE